MGIDAPRSASPLALTINGKRTDQETKDECFRLWIELGRSWAAVNRRTGIPDSTLRNWGLTEHWEQRRQDQASAFLPGKKTETAINLRFAAHSASMRLVEIGLDAVECGIKPDHKEVDALTKMAAAGGYSSVGTRNPLEGIDSLQPDTNDTDSIDMTGKSPSEIMLLEQAYRSKRRKP